MPQPAANQPPPPRPEWTGPALDFNPTPQVAAYILDTLSRPYSSLDEIANSHDVSVEALCLWLSRPDISARLDVLESVAARRARYVATCALPNAVSALAESLAGHTHDEGHIAYSDNFESIQLRLRERSEARRSATLLARICNFHTRAPSTSTPPAPPTPPRASSAPASRAEDPALTAADIAALLLHARAHLAELDHEAQQAGHVAPVNTLPDAWLSASAAPSPTTTPAPKPTSPAPTNYAAPDTPRPAAAIEQPKSNGPVPSRLQPAPHSPVPSVESPSPARPPIHTSTNAGQNANHRSQHSPSISCANGHASRNESPTPSPDSAGALTQVTIARAPPRPAHARP